MSETIDNPILNSPYEQPDRYYEIGPQGPTERSATVGVRVSLSSRSR
jgi:hypothetical protein